MPVHYEPKPPVSLDDASYIEAAREEAAYWSRPQPYTIDAWVGAPDGPMKRHINRRLTGRADTPWFETIASHGPFQRGVVLGNGGMLQEARILETNPSLHLTFCDIDAESLERRERSWSSRFAGRVATRLVDLNFGEFDESAYDVIISASTLHHVVNLEHAAWQINRALRPGGTFFLYDFTGASGFRFPHAQKHVFEEIYARERARRPRAALPAIRWRSVDDGTYSPFEAVRASETRAVLGRHLRVIEERGAGTIMDLLLFSGISEGWKRARRKRSLRDRALLLRRELVSAAPLVWEEILSPEAFRELAILDDVCTDAGIFPPCLTFARYGKRP